MGTLKIRDNLKKFWADDLGQSTTEYILILAVVVMIAVKFKSTFGGQLSGIITNLGQSLSTATQVDSSGN